MGTPLQLRPPLCPLPSAALARLLGQGRVLAALGKQPDPEVCAPTAFTPGPRQEQVFPQPGDPSLAVGVRAPEVPQLHHCFCSLSGKVPVRLGRTGLQHVPQSPPDQPSPRQAAVTSVISSAGLRVRWEPWSWLPGLRVPSPSPGRSRSLCPL